MLSAVIITSDASVRVSPSPDAVVRTLAALVPAAMEGVVRDVVLAAPAGNAELHKIADHAGCEIAEADLAEGIIGAGLAMARSDMLLVLRAGDAPGLGFFEEVADLSGRLSELGAIQVRAAPDSFLTRLLPSLSRPAGLIALRRNLPSQAPSLEALIRAAKPRATLEARLRRVG